MDTPPLTSNIHEQSNDPTKFESVILSHPLLLFAEQVLGKCTSLCPFLPSSLLGHVIAFHAVELVLLLLAMIFHHHHHLQAHQEICGALILKKPNILRKISVTYSHVVTAAKMEELALALEYANVRDLMYTGDYCGSYVLRLTHFFLAPQRRR
jgi:hypothetical protein